MTFPFPVFCPAVSDGGNDAFTKLLLHFEAADASTTFTDSSAAGHNFTAAGNAQIDTAQFKFGAASGHFDGAGDYIYDASGSADYAFGTGDFTIDFWLRTAASGVGQCLYDGRPSYTQGAHPTLFIDPSNKLNWWANGSSQIVSTTSVASGVWHHIGVARASGTTRLFLDGTQEGSSYSDATNYANPANRPYIGILGFDGSTYPLNGWLDEFRISKGIARWTANFTPPTSPYF